jgi:4-hydroxy-2-oxoheptanedioate aldolase
MRENRMKQRLAEGGWSTGVIIASADEQLVEVLARSGFGHIFIDCEHGHMSVRECETLVRAAEATDTTAIVRVPINHHDVILRHLDTGAQGVVIPQVITADDVERAVRSTYYYPKGERGLAGTRAADFGLTRSLSDYTTYANEQLAVFGLIENVRAIDNLPQILRVEGLTGITIGPADLSQSLGVPGQRNHPQVEEAIDEIIKQAVVAGVPVGINTSNGQEAAAALERGVRIFSVAAWGLLAGATRDYHAALPSA